MANSSHKITVVSHSPHTLDVVYTAGSYCAGGNKWLIVMRLYCSVHHSSEKPVLKSNSKCELQFDWPLSALCVGKSEVRNKSIFLCWCLIYIYVHLGLLCY